MNEVWFVLLPATFGLLGTLSGGYLTYRSTGAAELRAARRATRAALVTLLDSVLQVDQDGRRHRESAREAVALLMAEGLPANAAVDLLDAASHWARILPRLQDSHWASTGRASRLDPNGPLVKTGPDVRRLYATAIEELLTWLNAPWRPRRQTVQRIRDRLQELDSALTQRDLNDT
ncbi:hypothetical protein ACWCOV_19065 [Kribbella sp. NPDC002412]